MALPGRDEDTGRKSDRISRLRNNVASRVANFALNRIATPWYRDMIGGAISYGLNAAARDSREGRPVPAIVFDHVRGVVRREVPSSGSSGDLEGEQ